MTLLWSLISSGFSWLLGRLLGTTEAEEGEKAGRAEEEAQGAEQEVKDIAGAEKAQRGLDQSPEAIANDPENRG